MKSVSRQGVFAATLTPLTNDLSCDTGLLVDHVQYLLSTGCCGVALFGTTGEGPSFSVEERMAVLESLLKSGIAPQRIIVATGCAAIPDTVKLTKHALTSGCTEMLILPPFFFKEIDNEGLYQCYSRIIDDVGDPRLRLNLYHYPEMSAIPIIAEVVERLVAQYPDIISGIKDSTGEWDSASSFLQRFPNLNIYCGSEVLLPKLLQAGGSGTISGLANIAPDLLQKIFEFPTSEEETLVRISTLIEEIIRHPITTALKVLAAHLFNEPRWLLSRPPLGGQNETAASSLRAAASRAGLEPIRN